MFRPALLLLTLLFGNAVFAQTESTKVFGDYDVHYSVLNSTFITPQVAQAYGIVRGKDRALINIAVRKRLGRGVTKAKKSIVSGSSSDLIHSAELQFTEITEQESIYYIAELRFNNKELRTFTINIQPDPNIAPYTLKFNKTLYFN
ncbi:MAG: DUF4426 domain-containing protein [Oceanicoccus sp.]|uniref:DUF4426 domain-containing protein n=1 Tax=Oceanicoccus sp. TaxID=2691044 RepID=UPI00260FAA59|nr:DUF4426 domain-containing protein [Oceanicoccus sp.]MCP3908104.1 DUF4426 domain-containing protein [Oceanicoccus sp.]MDG1773795.1 DUF4426 domain-containing protein [Oceanicoccus sp.]